MEQGTKIADGKADLAGNLDHMDASKLSSGFMITNKMIHDIEVPPEKPNKEYYDEYCKLFINNYILTEQLNTLRRENKDLADKYRSIEVNSISCRKIAGPMVEQVGPKGQ